VGNFAGTFLPGVCERGLSLNQRLQLDLIFDDFHHVLDFMTVLLPLQVFGFLTNEFGEAGVS
jgi:hypothetical protein